VGCKLTDCSQSWSSRDDFDQFNCDSGLTCSVVLKFEFFENFLGVFASVFHSSHTGGLFCGGVIKESNPQVWSDVQLVEGRIWSVLVGILLVVKLSEAHGVEEALSWHNFHLTDDWTDCRLELVVINNNFVFRVAMSYDVFCDGHHSGVVDWLGDIRDWHLEKIGHIAIEESNAFVTNSEHTKLASIIMLHEGSDVSNNTWVGTTAKTLIRSKWN